MGAIKRKKHSKDEMYKGQQGNTMSQRESQLQAVQKRRLGLARQEGDRGGAGKRTT